MAILADLDSFDCKARLLSSKLDKAKSKDERSALRKELAMLQEEALLCTHDLHMIPVLMQEVHQNSGSLRDIGCDPCALYKELYDHRSQVNLSE